MTAAAITGGPPPGEGGLLQRLERMFREGRLPDPQSLRGIIIYTVLGLGIGMFLGMRFA
jgi:hypothetical protein